MRMNFCFHINYRMSGNKFVNKALCAAKWHRGHLWQTFIIKEIVSLLEMMRCNKSRRRENENRCYGTYGSRSSVQRFRADSSVPEKTR